MQIAKVPMGFFQLAYVVNDIHAAMKAWHETHGAGPFFYMEKVTIGPEGFRYRGKPSTLTLDIANGQLGPFEIELIAQHDDTPSVYREVYKRGEEGMHHMAIRTAAYDKTLSAYKARGYEIAHIGDTMGMNFCYFDARRDFDCMIEVLALSEMGRITGGRTAAAAVDWDGRDPYRPVALSGGQK
jgi:hypothetical protein